MASRNFVYALGHYDDVLYIFVTETAFWKKHGFMQDDYDDATEDWLDAKMAQIPADRSSESTYETDRARSLVEQKMTAFPEFQYSKSFDKYVNSL